MSSSEIKGVDAVTARLKNYPTRLLAATQASIYRWYAGKLGPLVLRRVPVRYGALHSSWTVRPPEISGTRIGVQAGFGGNSAPYAYLVEMRTGVRHPVGQDHFLSSAFAELKSSAVAWITADVARQMGVGR